MCASTSRTGSTTLTVGSKYSTRRPLDAGYRCRRSPSDLALDVSAAAPSWPRPPLTIESVRPQSKHLEPQRLEPRITVENYSRRLPFAFAFAWRGCGVGGFL